MERIPEIVHQSWHPLLQPLFDDKKMSLIRDEMLPNCYYYPDKTLIFKVFAMPLDKIKVVILGQDPYSKGEAIGKAFAVSETCPLPPSLRIVRDEVMNSGVERLSSVNIDTPKWRTLSHWSMQGVFLLNAALTVKRNEPGSHVGIWNWFTRSVVQIISKEVSPIWMLWGSKAAAFKEVIRAGESFKVNDILIAPHPVAETYEKPTKKYSGCNHFVLCNKLLKEDNKSIINW